MDLESGQVRKRRRVEELPIPKGVWSCARDLFWTRIMTDNPYPDDVDEFAQDCFLLAAEELGRDITGSLTEESIHTVCMGPP